MRSDINKHRGIPAKFIVNYPKVPGYVNTPKADVIPC